MVDSNYFGTIILKCINYKETHTEIHPKIDKTAIQSITNTVKTYKRIPNCAHQNVTQNERYITCCVVCISI